MAGRAEEDMSRRGDGETYACLHRLVDVDAGALENGGDDISVVLVYGAEKRSVAVALKQEARGENSNHKARASRES